MNDTNIKEIADRTIKPLLGDAGFVDADVEHKKNNEGDDSLYFTLHFAPGARITTGAAYIDAQIALQAALEELGDSRFPYFRYDYPDDPAPFDEEEAYGRQ